METNLPLITTAIWLSLFPLTFLIHFAEEYWVGEGYPAYLFRLRGTRLSEKRFIAFQTLNFGLFVAAGLISYLLNFPEIMVVILSGLVLCNGITHTVTAIWDGRYGPGLISSAFIWIPLGFISIMLMFGHISNTRLAIATLIGFAINGVVALLTLRGGRFT